MVRTRRARPAPCRLRRCLEQMLLSAYAQNGGDTHRPRTVVATVTTVHTYFYCSLHVRAGTCHVVISGLLKKPSFDFLQAAYALVGHGSHPEAPAKAAQHVYASFPFFAIPEIDVERGARRPYACVRDAILRQFAASRDVATALDDVRLRFGVVA